MSVGLVTGLAVVLPLAGALLILLLGRWPNVREGVSLVTAGALLTLVLRLVDPVKAGLRPELVLVEVMPGIPLALRVEPLGLVFALVASFLWIVTTLYSIGYMRSHHEENQTRFFAFFAISIAAAMGVAFSANLFTLFAFYEVLTLCTFPLVTHHGTEEAKKAGRVYLGILLFTSIGFQLLAVIWTWQLAGTVDFQEGGILSGTASGGVLSVILVLFVFGVGKAAVMPFHRWLPAAMVAPTPVSALLHAVAVVKAGVFTILKVSVYVFGLDLLGELASTPWLAWAAASTIILGSLVALTKDNLKARLAYSTISQLSYIVLGALLANEWGIIGGGMHIAMHAFGKITLFFAAGAVLVAAHETDISRMGGLGRAMPITFGAFFVGSLSIIGIPPAGGSWSKWYLGLGTLEAGQIGLLAVLMVSSLLSLVYLLEVPVRAFFGQPPDGVNLQAGMREAPWPSVLAMVITALATVGLFVYPDPVFDLMKLVLP
ncbi:MAG: monovalent cation/H+ antiporter subunit D family protein [Gemmatimonadetes bacterium]|nr:monovalent cation/H+ antiporter subunit D family protein [Gemmatimonadota bacterium]